VPQDRHKATSAASTVSSSQVSLWHPENVTYRCFLSDLTGFVKLRRTRPSLQHYLQDSWPWY